MEKTRDKSLKEQVNIKKVASTHTVKSVNARARSSAPGTVPLSIRLNPQLQEVLEREAAAHEQSLRDYLRAIIEQRHEERVKVVEEIALKEVQVKAIAQVVEKGTRSAIHQLSEEISSELSQVRKKADGIQPEVIARKVYERVHSQLEDSSQEVKHLLGFNLKDIANGIAREVHELRWFFMKSLSWAGALVAFLIVLSSLTTVCFLYSAYPWEIGEVRQRFLRGLAFERMFLESPPNVQEGVKNLFLTGQCLKEGKK